MYRHEFPEPGSQAPPSGLYWRNNGAKAPRTSGTGQGFSEGHAGKQSWAGSPSPTLEEKALLYLSHGVAVPQFPLLSRGEIIKPTSWVL